MSELPPLDVSSIPLSSPTASPSSDSVVGGAVPTRQGHRFGIGQLSPLNTSAPSTHTAPLSPRLAGIMLSGTSEQKADPSQTEQREYKSVAEYVTAMGGKRAISKILIANNGIAAVKAIRSIKRWAYETFGNEKMISFVAMATPEDLKANAEYIHLADEFITVPGGSNNHNYANVMLITEIAERTGAHAVWAGWGHASENPKLPESLSKTKNNVVWIGPPPSAMRALGDKIGSTLIAQSAGVPCVPWNGTGIHVDYAKSGLPPDVYQRACVRTKEEAVEAAERIGYPVMIKASEGGGGKGIRKVEKREQIELAFGQVQGEVPGSPIFLMKLCPVARHLEVQLLADEWGDAIAVSGRDCSIQRRHQKIIEEGPVVAAPKDIWKQMERAAVRLAKEVGYAGAGTVEYLFTPNNEYFFLELNPRLQVEHPVTELITGVNLPAAQLQVAMGIPLHRLPGVRRLYGRSRTGDNRIDFDNEDTRLLPGHVIACRITAENPDMAFQPTSGQIQELNFRSTPDVWGYFSVGSYGGVHEYSDSQFGHLFALGETREMARRNMVVALKELSIRGDMRTTVEFLPKILETEDYRKGNVSTTWLEKVMAQHTVQAEKPAAHLVVILGALFRAFTQSTAHMTEYTQTLDRGQMPSQALHNSLVEMQLDLIYDKIKYEFTVTRSAPNSFDMTVGTSKRVISADVHTLADGGLLVLLDGKKHVVYGQEFPSGLRLTVDGKTCLFSVEYDPTQLRSSMAGKLVRFLVPDGTHLEKNQPYAEMEVMKMYVTLMAPERGTLRIVKPEGSVMESGDLIAALDVDDPDTVEKADLYQGEFPPVGPPIHIGEKPNLLLIDALKKLENMLSGYKLGQGVADEALNMLMKCLRNPRLPLLQFEAVFSALAGRVPESLYDSFQSIAKEYANSFTNDRFYWESPEPFPVVEIQSAIDTALMQQTREDEQNKLRKNIVPVLELLDRYRGGNHTYAVHILQSLIRQFYDVESHFNNSKQPESVIKLLRRQFKDDTQAVVNIALAHNQVPSRAGLITTLLSIVETQLAPLLGDFVPVLKQLSTLNGKPYSAVALKARQLLIRHELPSSEQRRIAIQTILQSAVQTLAPEERLSRLSLLIHQSQPIADALLSFLDSGNNAMKAAAMEVYVRRVYQVYTIVSMQIDFDAKSDLLKARWEFFMDLEKLEAEIQSEQDDDAKEEGATRPATAAGATGHEAEEEAALRSKKLNRSYLGMRAVDSVSNLQSLNKDVGPPVLNRMPSGGKQTTPTAASADASKSKKGAKVAPLSDKPLSVAVKSEEVSRVGVMAYCKTFESLKKNFETILQDFPLSVPSPSSASSGGQSPASTGSGRQPTSARGGKEPVHVLYVSCKWGSRIASDDQLTAYFGTFLKTFGKSLHTRGIRRVTFVVAHAGDEYPSYFTFRHRLDYGEDTIIRHIEPSNALHLELTRLSNFKLRFVPTTNRMIHMFAAFPLNTDNPAGQGAKKRGDDEAYDGRRMFARVIVRRVDSAFLNNGESPLPPNTPSAASAVPASPGQESIGSGSGSFFNNTTAISPGFGTATAGSMGAAPAEAMVSPSSTPSPDLLSAMKGTGARTGLLKPVDLDAYPETEIAFVEALNALEMAMGSESRKWRNGSIFINVLVEAFIDPRYVEAVIRMLARRYSDKIQRSHINIVEFQLQMKLDPTVNQFTPVRFVATNPTNADLRVHVYTHKRDPQTGRTVFASMNPYDKGELDGKEISAPYPVTRPFDKPRQLAESLGTTYCYDWPALIEKALSQVWRHFRKAVHQSPIAQQFIAEALKLAHQNTATGDKSFAPGGEKFDVQVHIVNALKKLAPHLADDKSCVSLLALLAPKMPTANTLPAPVTVNPSFSAAVKTAAPNQSFDWYHTSLAPRESFSDSIELILVPVNSPEAQAAGGEAGSMPQRDGFKLVESKRTMGQNNIGMVAWRVTMRTPTHPAGRSLVVISNDITFQAGTFGVQEDLLFQLASEYARQRKLPRIYIAANSGARIGLADEVRSKIRVAWAGNDPMKGFQYMYLSEADYNELKDSVVCTRQVVKGEDAGGSHNEEVRYVINDIIGRRSGLGVENLRGSGMIAGETSLAYDEIFTLTYVTGRTVGIGSYLARLGQRCIQKKDSSIILTGFSALNKLLGRPVYNSNVQLGGVDIMYTNGVSHLTVEHDLEGVHHILNWLSFVPARRFEAPSILPLPASFVDPIERSVAWRPPKEPYDPHFLIDGVLDDGGQWTGGFFDKGSFTELLGGWARTVICGRARLGGIPMGVIAVETRTIEDNIPADPAVPESKEQNVVRAGQVWYPDSAYKTAQAIKDMAAEDLPIMIFANWRGFSGGMQDMLREVLKFGSYIVDNLRTHNQPIFVYLPPNANLRGGAWVVVDETINERMMEMYADEDSRGGVLEPEGTVDVKFRKEDLLQLMHRLDAQIGKWDKELEKERAEAAKADKHTHTPATAQATSPQPQLSIVVNATGSRPAPADKPADGSESKAAASEKEKELLALIKKRETALLPLYHQAATNFADLHDTPGRMKAKGVIRAVVKWKTSRAFFYWRLRRRLFEYEYGKKIQTLQLKSTKKPADIESWRAALATFKSWVAKDMGHDNTNNMWDNDIMLLQWMESHRTFLDGELRALELSAIQTEVSQLAVSDPAAFAQGIVAALASLSGPEQQKFKNSLRGLLKL